MKPKNPQATSNIEETIIAYGVEVRGNLKVEADLALDGIIDGSVHAKGNVTLGENAQIKGNLQGNAVVVAGKVFGNVKANVSLVVQSSGQVIGDVDTAGLVVEEGGVIRGQLKMPLPANSPKPEPEG